MAVGVVANEKDNVVLSKPANALSVEEAGMIPATTLTYFEDTYLFKSSGKVLSLEIIPDAEDAKVKLPEGIAKLRIVLDRTIYHPQGGGQPSDVGTIVDQDGLLPELKVTFTHMNKEDGRVFHDCDVAEEIANVWIESGKDKVVKMEIDEAIRRANARFHSGGHLIDSCMKEVAGYQATKGMHFPGVCYVEFQLSKEQKEGLDKEQVMKDLQAKIDEKTSQDEAVVISRDENNVRHIAFAGTKCPCGGTHVQNTTELKGIKIKSLKMKKDILKVSYECV